jgi:DNA polymerase-3 subunit gamma/tau
MDRDKSLPLHLKYRPQNFDEFVGNEAVIESLRNILSRDKGEIRSFLLTGDSGCGKTTIARLIKNELKCSDLDFYEYNSASVRGIDTVREIADSCRYAPMSGGVKIYLLDEIHKATNDAQNALLKLLEDTPVHVRFVLATTDPDKLIKTIRTRCSTFHLAQLRRNQILKLLKWICKEENHEVSDSLLMKISNFCDGSPRQAIVLLDQVIQVDNEELAEQVLIDCTVDDKKVLDLCQALIDKKSWATVSSILKNLLDDDPEHIRLAVLSYFAKVLLTKDSIRLEAMSRWFEEPFFNSGKSLLILACFRANAT